MRYENGQLFSDPLPAYDWDVKAECQRRIFLAYPLWKQEALERDGGADRDAMRAELTRLRLLSRALCRQNPIPSDYRDDQYWKGNPLAGDAINYQSAAGLHAMMGAASGQPGAPIHFSPNITIHAPAVTVSNTSTNNSDAPPSEAAPAPVALVSGPPPPGPVSPGGGERPLQPQIAPQAAIVQQPATPPPTLAQPPHTTHYGAVHPATGKMPMVDAAIQTINTDRDRVFQDIWPAAKEIAAEAAGRALKGNDASLEMILPLASKEGLTADAYCQKILTERAEAHHLILRIDDIAEKAIAAVRAAQAADDIGLATLAARDAFASVTKKAAG